MARAQFPEFVVRNITEEEGEEGVRTFGGETLEPSESPEEGLDDQFDFRE